MVCNNVLQRSLLITILFIKTDGTLKHRLLVTVLLLSAYADKAESDWVTWFKCKKVGDGRGRVLGSLPDYNATELDIMNCHITEIQVGDIVDLPNLYLIFLNGNNLEHLNPAVFDSCPKLKSLRLDSNRFREVPAFGEHPSFPDVTYIDISKNQITKLVNPRNFPSKLQSVNLDYNPIEYVHPDMFKGLSDIHTISLTNTKLKTIPNTLFQLRSLKKVYLQFGQIESIPSDAFVGTKLKELSFEGNKLTYLPANFVTNLNISGFHFEFYFYGNPWHCACLAELLAEVKRIGVSEYGGVDQPYLDGSPQCVSGRDTDKCPRNTH